MSVPIDLSLGRSARLEAVERVWELTPHVWGRQFDGDARAQLSFAVGRVAAVVAGRRHDCQLAFEMVRLAETRVIMNPDRVQVVGPGGYPQLVELLRLDGRVQSIPIVVASESNSSDRAVLWDGHHRWRSYGLAGRGSIPAWTCRFVPGDGLLVPTEPSQTQT